jgi:hypothetical protein
MIHFLGAPGATSQLGIHLETPRRDPWAKAASVGEFTRASAVT